MFDIFEQKAGDETTKCSAVRIMSYTNVFRPPVPDLSITGRLTDRQEHISTVTFTTKLRFSNFRNIFYYFNQRKSMIYRTQMFQTTRISFFLETSKLKKKLEYDIDSKSGKLVSLIF